MKSLAAVLLMLFLLVRCDRVRSEGESIQTPVTSDAAERAQEEARLNHALETTMATLRAARTIALYEVANQFDADFQQVSENEKVAGYPIRRKRELSATEAAPLVQVLTARSTYFEAGNGWMCIFEPHHVLRVVSAERTIDVVICLQCGDVAFVENGKQIILKSVRPAWASRLTSLVEAAHPARSSFDSALQPTPFRAP